MMHKRNMKDYKLRVEYEKNEIEHKAKQAFIRLNASLKFDRPFTDYATYLREEQEKAVAAAAAAAAVVKEDKKEETKAKAGATTTTKDGKDSKKVTSHQAPGHYLPEFVRPISLTPIRNRCLVSGRSRGIVTCYSLSRIAFQDLARYGKIPGVQKSSW